MDKEDIEKNIEKIIHRKFRDTPIQYPSNIWNIKWDVINEFKRDIIPDIVKFIMILQDDIKDKEDFND